MKIDEIPHLGRSPEMMIGVVIDIICEYFSLERNEILSKRKPTRIAFPRQIGMYISRRLLPFSLMEICEQFNKKQHGTVIHAGKKIQKRLIADDVLSETISTLVRRIEEKLECTPPLSLSPHEFIDGAGV